MTKDTDSPEPTPQPTPTGAPGEKPLSEAAKALKASDEKHDKLRREGKIPDWVK